MFSGVGASLKKEEFLAVGLPVVTTRIGMRGYELTPGIEVVTAGPDDFAAVVRELLQNHAKRRDLRNRGSRYARGNLDWPRLSASLGTALARLLPARPVQRAPARKTRLLVVTYRYTEAPRGGAETFLQSMLKELHTLGGYEIDLVCPAVDGIRDHLHFGARYEDSRESQAPPSFLAGLRRFPPDPVDEDAMFSGSRRLFLVWQEEDLVQARRLRGHYRDPVLLGGWYFVERGPQGARRWTGGEAEIHVPRDTASQLVLKGTSPGARRMDVSVDGVVRASARLAGRFDLAVELDATHDSLVRLSVDRTTCVDTDPRTLGVCIESLRLRGPDGALHALDLELDFAAVLRRDAPATWVASLIEAAQARRPEDDALFLRGRGPHSASLDAWLAGHTGNYDAVLAHGVPFAPVVRAVEHAAAASVPCVVLPHFHMDDKYYHWQDYYAAFRQAQRVIAAPDVSRPWFFDRIGAQAVVLPGGGADPAEFIPDPAREGRFRELHGATRPFVLVLGRKSGAKRWQQVVEAVALVNRDGHRLDLVMIGPDADGVAIEGPFVHYYGAQPREVVLGALACCTCLASMSASESFGIVLVEAWLSARPVAAARGTTAFAELVEDAVDGFLVANESELAGALERYLLDPVLAAAHAQRGRAKALARYTWNAVAQGVERCLVELTDTTAAAASTEGRAHV